MFKKFIKAKKGKELIELIVLTPFLIFLIIFTALTITKHIISSEVIDTTSHYMRSIITSKTFYNALTSLADEVETQDKDITVISITVIDKKDSKNTKTITFSDDPDSSIYFSNLVYKLNNKNEFNIYVSDDFTTMYRDVESLWDRGNYVSITTLKGIAPIINEITKIQIYNPSKEERTTLNFGISGTVYAETKNIIIS